MDSNKAFQIFEIGINKLLFGPKGLNDQIPYSDLTVWRFEYSLKEFHLLT